MMIRDPDGGSLRHCSEVIAPDEWELTLGRLGLGSNELMCTS